MTGERILTVTVTGGLESAVGCSWESGNGDVMQCCKWFLIISYGITKRDARP
jgi:hypothetical protein